MGQRVDSIAHCWIQKPIQVEMPGTSQDETQAKQRVKPVKPKIVKESAHARERADKSKRTRGALSKRPAEKSMKKQKTGTAKPRMEMNMTTVTEGAAKGWQIKAIETANGHVAAHFRSKSNAKWAKWDELP